MEESSSMVLLKSASKPRQGISRRKLRRPSPHHQNKTPRKETPSPLIVNEDILQEALTIAENVQISDDSDLPSPLSSCLKTQSDSSEADFDASKRHPSVFKARSNEAPGLASEPITTGTRGVLMVLKAPRRGHNLVEMVLLSLSNKCTATTTTKELRIRTNWRRGQKRRFRRHQ